MTNNLNKIGQLVKLNPPNIVIDKASVLFESSADELSVEIGDQHEVQNTSFYTYLDGTLSFNSRDCLLLCAALYYVSKPEADIPEKFDELQIFYTSEDIRRKNKKSGDSVAAAFLGIKFFSSNIFESAIELLGSSPSHNTFTILRGIARALPFVKTPTPNELTGITIAQFDNTNGDMLRGALFSELRDYLSQNTELAELTYLEIKNQYQEELWNLYRACVTSFAQAGQREEATARVIKDIAERGNVTLPALASLSEMTFYCKDNEDLLTKIESCLIENTTSDDEDIKLRAIWSLSHTAEFNSQLLDHIISESQNGNKTASFALREHLILHRQNNDLTLVKKLLPVLITLQANEVDHLDYTISEIVKESAEGAEFIADWLTKWCLQNVSNKAEDKDFSGAFESTISELHNASKLETLMTQWIESDERKLGISFSNVIGFLWVTGVRELELDKDHLDGLSKLDLRYLSRRIWGWTYHDSFLLSLCWSMLNTHNAKERTFPWVYHMIVEYIGINYPKPTFDWLSEKEKTTKNKDIIALIIQVRGALLEYGGKLDNLPIRHELKCNANVKRNIRLVRESKSRDTQNKANEKSVLLNLVNRVPLKSGTGWFSFRNFEMTEINRLGHYEHTATLPYNAVYDPVNDAIERLLFRNSTRDEE